MTRNGNYDIAPTSIEIDKLNYTYDSYNQNRLIKVTDLTNSPLGFSDGANYPIEYDYDGHGNMIRDDNKGITSILYNHLNLPTQITFSGTTTRKIQYLYDAVGTKQKKIVTNGTLITSIDYLSGFQYQNNVLEFFPHAEGYVKCTERYFNYVFNYTDHLGNVRLSYAKDPNGFATRVLEENHYYPFGLKHTNYDNSTQRFMRGIGDGDDIPIFIATDIFGSSAFKFKYNGKEWQDELGLNMYDYGARVYMPDIGRWGATDNKAEFYFANSPYVYALNTPTNAIDPDGNLVIFINGLGGGGANYWRNYDTSKDNWLSQPNKISFDLQVSKHLNDQNRRYYDGSPGTLSHDLFSSNRYTDGYAKGKEEAASIIGSLARDPQGNIIETIKIITHSMGGVYGKGFVKALKEYIKKSKDPQVRKALITLVADFDPFQAGSKLGIADSNIYTQQFINEGWSDFLNAGWLANQEEEGADEVVYNERKTSHFIEAFITNVSDIKEGTYEWDEKKQEWNCTSCKN